MWNSPSCTRCKTRRIKCDRARPICQKCENSNYTECVYPEGLDAVLRDQTQLAAQRTHERWRSRSRQRQDNSTSSTARLQSSNRSSSTRPESLPRLTVDLPEPILSRFFYDWVLDVGPELDKLHNYFPDLYQINRHNPESGLSNAISALALINYAKKCDSPELIPQARAHCNNAMKLMRRSLIDPDVSYATEILTTIRLLSWFEVMINSSFTNDGSYMAHVKGQNNLFGLLALQKTHPTVDVLLLVTTLTEIMLTSMSRGIKFPCPRSFVIPFFQQVMQPHMIEHWHLMFDIVELFYSWKNLLAKFLLQPTVHSHVHDLCEIIDRGHHYDKRLDQWFAELPEGFKITYKPFEIVTPCMSSIFESLTWRPRSTLVCPDFATEQCWREWTGVQVFLRQAILTSIEHLESKGFGLGHPAISLLNYMEKEELQSLLAYRMQLAWEAVVSVLIKSIPSKSETETELKNLCGIRGVWAFGATVSPHVCLLQNPYLEAAIPGCREWNQRLMRLNIDTFGYARMSAYLELELTQFDPFRLQVWSLAQENEDRGPNE